MNVSILGPQGSGKGTQIERLTQRFDFAVFESGRELRRIAQSETQIGQEIKAILNLGELIPDEHIYFLTKDWLGNIPPERNILFDGYPRKLTQAKDIASLLADRNQKIDLVLSLVISDEVAIERLVGRMLCQTQEHVYNTLTHPPQTSGICDFDSSPLVRRDDETPETVKKRLALFHAETEPLLNLFRKISKVEEINGDQPVDLVGARIQDILAKHITQKV